MDEPHADPTPSTPALARAVRDDDLRAAAAVLDAVGTLYAVRSSASGEGAPGASRSPDAEEIGAVTDDRRFVPFYFTEAARARAYVREQGLVAEGEAPRIVERSVRECVRRCLDGDFGGLVVDPGTPEPAALGPRELTRVREHLRSDDLSDAAPPPAEARLAPPPHALDLADRVRRSPDLERVEAPDVDPGECRDVVRELRELASEGRMPPWELVDTLAFRLAFHVPRAPEPVRGLRWPFTVRHPRDGRTPAVAVFADEEDAAEALAEAGGPVETVRLSGLEAFRWVLAAPVPVEEILVFGHPAEPPVPVPDRLALAALYPHAFPEVDLRRVERVPLEGLGALPGARGTKPECVRALVEGAGDLVEARRTDGGPADPVEHRGRTLLPVFSGRDALRRYRSTDEGRGLEPREASGAGPAPFRRWLLESTEGDGLILDPGSETPLVLDPTDLAVLWLWADEGTQPDGRDLVDAVSGIRDDLGPRVAGRIVADWPRYYWAVRAGGGEDGPGTLSLPGRDACPVFTSEERIRGFLEAVRDRELVEEDVRPLLYLTSWAFNVFQEMRTRYREGGWIDPDPDDVVRRIDDHDGTASGGDDPTFGGFPVTEEVLRAALARIEWRLQPRVDGFLAPG